MRYHIASIYDFVSNVAAGCQSSPSIYDGLKVQEVLDAAIRSSEIRTWVERV
jgi:hypothetical protein